MSTTVGFFLPLADHGSLQSSLVFLGPVALMLLFLICWTLLDRRRRRNTP